MKGLKIIKSKTWDSSFVIWMTKQWHTISICQWDPRVYKSNPNPTQFWPKKYVLIVFGFSLIFKVGVVLRSKHELTLLIKNYLFIIKAKYMLSIWNVSSPKRTSISNLEMEVGNYIIPQITRFKYLGSFIKNNREIELNVNYWVHVTWLKWRKVSGVLCDTKLLFKLKRKFYRTYKICNVMQDWMLSY